MSLMIKNKRCPFCGCFDVKVMSQGPECWAQCPECNARGPIYISEAKAGRNEVIACIKLWNTRKGKVGRPPEPPAGPLGSYPAKVLNKDGIAHGTKI